MKLLFVVSGIGYGDSTREHANIRAVKKAFPRAKILVAGYDNSYEYFKNKYKTVRIEGYKLPGKKLKINIGRFALANIFLPLFWFTSTLKVKLQEFNFKPDLIISDFEPVGLSLATLLGKKCLVVFGYDPLLFREYDKKNKVNYKVRTQAKYFEYLYSQAHMVALPTLGKKRRIVDYVYVNPIVRKEPKDLPSEKDLMNKLKLRKKPILVMLGGSEFGTRLALDINKIAVKHKKEDFLIFGANIKRVKLNENVSYVRYADDVLKYLKVAKGVIALGGQLTLAEALVYKKPVLCFPIKDHVEQILNAHSVRNLVMVSKESNYKTVDRKVGEFIKKLPILKKKVVKYNLKAGGSKEIVNLIKVALEK
ncbi:hypothetical protein HOE91_05925 [archaeon]|jgi:uncharacterized protein (TIGR00661 family)|nr:hypothetical protein [archaeon]MBT4440484.1 hypothetical protein [archaeon]